MPVFKRFVFLAFFALSCQAVQAAPAPAEAGAPLLALQEMDRRVAGIAHRIASANAAVCARTMPLAGLLVHSADQYAAAARPDAVAAFGLTDAPAILVVVPGSAADRAGLRAGDAILAVAGRDFPPERLRRKGSYARIRKFEDFLLARLAEGPVAIDYLRGGSRHSTLLEREMGCVSRVQLIPSEKRNAGADGTYAQLTTAIVDYVRSDDELALVIAHEMAHNILSHRVRLDAQGVSRGIFKAIDGSAGKIRRTEVEADYLALYLVARAGYDVTVAPDFWRRFSPGGLTALFSDGTHPGQSSRVEAAERTIAEIEGKRRRGEPLVPHLPTATGS